MEPSDAPTASLGRSPVEPFWTGGPGIAARPDASLRTRGCPSRVRIPTTSDERTATPLPPARRALLRPANQPGARRRVGRGAVPRLGFAGRSWGRLGPRGGVVALLGAAGGA